MENSEHPSATTSLFPFPPSSPVPASNPPPLAPVPMPTEEEVAMLTSLSSPRDAVEKAIRVGEGKKMCEKSKNARRKKMNCTKTGKLQIPPLWFHTFLL